MYVSQVKQCAIIRWRHIAISNKYKGISGVIRLTRQWCWLQEPFRGFLVAARGETGQLLGIWAIPYTEPGQAR